MTDLIPQFGGGLRTLAAFVAALIVIVAVHEFGHYIAGRWSGIRAEVFSVGMGPRLWSRRDKRGTLWQFAAIPIGGYVRFLGDTNAASAGAGAAVDPALRRQTLAGAPLWARAVTVAAGPIFSFLLAIVIFAGFTLVRGAPVEAPTVGRLLPTPPGVTMALQSGDRITAIAGQPVARWSDLVTIAGRVPPAPTQDWTVTRDGTSLTVPGPDPMPARIGGVAPNSAAAEAGLRPGDVIIAVDGTTIARFDALRPVVEAAAGAPLSLRVWRQGRGEAEVTLTPREQDLPRAGGGFEKRWLIGVNGGGSYFDPATRAVGPLEAVWRGVQMTWTVVSGSLIGLWATLTGQISSCNIGGAISIAESTGQAASVGVGQLVWWIGVLSAAIGFMNILPIPVLDGGYLAFYAWEAVTGRKPSDRVIRWLSTAGLAVVLGLMIFGLSNDLFCP